MQGEFYIIRNQNNLDYARGAMSKIEPSEKTPYAVKIEPYKLKRSDLQNRYMWGWVYKQIALTLSDRGIVIRCEDDREIPYTSDILHEIFKGKFLVKEVVESGGKTLTLYYSTTKLNTKQFTEYLDSVKRFVHQFWNITVAEPQDGIYKQYLNELKRAA